MPTKTSEKRITFEWTFPTQGSILVGLEEIFSILIKSSYAIRWAWLSAVLAHEGWLNGVQADKLLMHLIHVGILESEKSDGITYVSLSQSARDFVLDIRGQTWYYEPRKLFHIERSMELETLLRQSENR